MGGLRITSWNVNGIRNPFGYQPWRDKRSYAAMFDILEADIICMQETKIQRKDLQDDMVLVPGFDAYFSLPKHKKGYSGVVIYTRNAVCSPIRCEEGITGILTPPNTSSSFSDLPEPQQIGGYPSHFQMSGLLDAATLDSEGRCIILEFPAFVLIGTYCPANRDETRDEFRVGFLTALDARVRNLVAMGKRVILIGDLNIIREQLDTANAEEQLRKHGMTGEEYMSTPARRMLNQLVVGGKVFGERDEGRERGVLWDVCRGFHPDRRGMFTCWETKINARPGNFGSRIDYVLCSKDMKDWFSRSDIQDGLLGSDHCPVFAVLKDDVEIDGKTVPLRDIMNPPGVYENGIMRREWSTKDLLPMSAKLIPEFDRRRNIKDMFSRKPSLVAQASNLSENTNPSTPLPVKSPMTNSDQNETNDEPQLVAVQEAPKPGFETSLGSKPLQSSPKLVTKRSSETASGPSKRTKAGKSTSAKGTLEKSQSKLSGFFMPKAPAEKTPSTPTRDTINEQTATTNFATPEKGLTEFEAGTSKGYLDAASMNIDSPSQRSVDSPNKAFNINDQEDVVDQVVAREAWSNLLKKRVPPNCEHNLPCISQLTKKPGVNRGRSFYMCSQPLGPSGVKEKGTQWRCGTFIWSSDWGNSNDTV